MQDVVFFNFFTVGGLASVAFFALSAIFLLAIPGKSKATLHLGLSFLGAAFLALAYVPGTSIYDPVAAYHRWMTIPAVFIGFTHFGQFLYYFPRRIAPRFGFWVGVVQYVIMITLTVYFIYVSLNVEQVYLFSGHFYDFDADALSALVGRFILLYVLHMILVCVAQIITSPGYRLAVFAILVMIILGMIGPGITNVASRDGLLSREFHQTYITIASVLGYFVVFIIYINNTGDKTTFMAKIVGVSLVVFLVMYVVLSFIMFADREEAYSILHKERTGRLAVDPGYPGGDLKYLARFDNASGGTTLLRGERGTAPDFSNQREDFENAALFARIAALDPGGFPGNLEALLKETPPHFAGYRIWLSEKGATVAGPADLLEAALKLERPLLFRFNKTRKLPAEGFRDAFKQTLGGMDGELKPFSRMFQTYLAAHPDQKGDELRSEVLKLMRPFLPPGRARFRAAGSDHFVAFLFYDPARRAVFEAGYSYRSYREWFHGLGVKMLVILAGAILTILSYRFFFRGTLVLPLRTLIRSVHKVNKGNLNVNVPVKVEDEIGFLSHSFNGMVASIREARDELQKYAGQLEDKVEERTAELKNTLATVQQLKEKQDGDYFLTSLILKPLAANNVESETVSIDFMVEQMKKFEFRRWREEIGGDMCSAHSIRLKDRPHTVFLNADAMGKSIQGAGGALVLGAVFESIIERTHMSSAMRDQHPERWLKNAFVELQKVFESFDGSMLISLVIGLVDDGTGLLYYVNAEHPWTALYRRGTARFIDDPEITFRKLGIADLEGKIKIQILQLEPGDVLLSGSDGRDDLILERRDDGQRIINEDETLFLGAVETGDGDLRLIHQRLQEKGEFSDDFSLLRLAYLEDAPVREDDREQGVNEHLGRARTFIGEENYEDAEAQLIKALELVPFHRKALKALVRLYMQQKRYNVAAPHLREYILRSPFDTEMIYFASFIARKHRNFVESADLGERVRLRSPHLLQNLINLAEAYGGMGNHKRAEKLLEEVFAIDPEHSRGKKLEAALRARG